MKTPAFTIRAPRPSEAKAVAALMFALWPEEGAAAFPHDVKKLRLHCCDTAHSALFIAEGDGKPVGFAGVGVRKWSEANDTGPIPHVEGWYVAPSWRRLGAGRALLRACESWARSEGFRQISSDTWASNRRSIAAHNAAGFKTASRMVYFLKKLS